MSAKLTRAELDYLTKLFDDASPLPSAFGGENNIVLKLIAHVRAQDDALREIADECAAWGGKPKPLGLIGSIARAAQMEE